MWTLILFVHAGLLSTKDSMAITNVEGFKSQSACVAAGKASESLVKGTTKDLVFTCVEIK